MYNADKDKKIMEFPNIEIQNGTFLNISMYSYNDGEPKVGFLKIQKTKEKEYISPKVPRLSRDSIMPVIKTLTAANKVIDDIIAKEKVKTAEEYLNDININELYL